MRFITLSPLLQWSLLFDVICGMQQLLPNKPQKLSTYYTLSSNQDATTQQQYQRNSSSRRNVLKSITTGVATSLPLMIPTLIVLPSQSIVANAATTTTTPTPLNTKYFRAYQVQPDSGEKLNPTLITLPVSGSFFWIDCCESILRCGNDMTYSRC